MEIQKAKIIIPSINEFEFKIDYNETDRKNHTYEIETHSHREFEIYINLSGDVSFLVNNNLYPMSRGDVIIARPYEEHHCVYRSSAKHSFFWILFNLEKNQPIADFFSTNCLNYISPKKEFKEEIIELFFKLTNGTLSETERLYIFFRIIFILNESSQTINNKPQNIPKDLTSTLYYIDNHLSENLQISDIAKALFISESTIRRRFKEYLNTNPLLFIQKRKLHCAAEMLKQGETVINAGINVGYTDNSYFIQLFKRQYGVTPYQYKKNIHKR